MRALVVVGRKHIRARHAVFPAAACRSRCGRVQGSCPQPATPDPPAGITNFGEPLKPAASRCILSADHGIFRMTQDNHYLWIDRLYLRSAPHGPQEFGLEHRLLDIDGDGSKVWVSNCTFQGARDYSEGIMLWSETAAAHFEGAPRPALPPPDHYACCRAIVSMPRRRVTDACCQACA